MSLIELRGVCKVYLLGEMKVEALRDVSLSIEQGEYLAVMGPSGSGKSTLMNMLGCLDHATEGSYMLDGEEVADMSRDARARFRNRKIGFVFQNFNLLSRTSALENVELPLRISEWDRTERQKRAADCLEMVGLSSRSHHRPYELSGGELQRVAVARAIAHRPALILADEPTGELDLAKGAEIISLLKEIASEENVGIVVATHDEAMAEIADVTRQISDGTFIT